MQSLYRVTPSELLDLIDDLLRSRHLQLEHRPAVQGAVQALGCSHTVSFDKGAVRWTGMTLLDLDTP